MIGYKKALTNAMIGHKLALGKHMLGHKLALGDMPNISVMTRELGGHKKAGGLERAKRGGGWQLGQYA